MPATIASRVALAAPVFVRTPTGQVEHPAELSTTNGARHGRAGNKCSLANSRRCDRLYVWPHSLPSDRSAASTPPKATRLAAAAAPAETHQPAAASWSYSVERTTRQQMGINLRASAGPARQTRQTPAASSLLAPPSQSRPNPRHLLSGVSRAPSPMMRLRRASLNSLALDAESDEGDSSRPARPSRRESVALIFDMLTCGQDAQAGTKAIEFYTRVRWPPHYCRSESPQWLKWTPPLSTSREANKSVRILNRCLWLSAPSAPSRRYPESW